MTKLSVIISHRNDPVMLNITLNSALEAFKSVAKKCEIIVVDNSDEPIFNAVTKEFRGFYKSFKNIKFFQHSPPSNHSARMLAAEKASGEYILCVDSHMLFGHNVIIDALKFLNRHRRTNLGFCHFPIRHSDRGNSDMIRSMDIHKNGTPYLKRYTLKHGVEQKILFKFIPWMCNRDWYLNTLRGYITHAKHHIVATGGEMLQQIKAWMLGYENWIMPTNPIIHIGPFNAQFRKFVGINYRNYPMTDNYPTGFGVILAFFILGGDNFGYKQAKLAAQRIYRLHQINVDDYWPAARALGMSEHKWLTRNAKISYRKLLATKPWMH